MLTEVPGSRLQVRDADQGCGGTTTTPGEAANATWTEVYRWSPSGQALRSTHLCALGNSQHAAYPPHRLLISFF